VTAQHPGLSSSGMLVPHPNGQRGSLTKA